LLIIQGGAGSGKSTLINILAQRVELILRQSGDDPDKPYVLKAAFTGTAAANIDGMTLHSAFNFNFGNEFLSLGDKIRDEKRDYLKNLALIIIDELSMLKADMLYQLDLRLRELKQNMEDPFGGCSIFLFGDILQLKPVMGRFIFEKPMCSDYNLSHLIDPLWQKFQAILLVQNHRQGEDFMYADILNRIRTGEQTEEDCRILEQRVKQEGDPDLPDNALYIICNNLGVNKMNEKKLENVDSQLYTFEAEIKRSGKKTNKPKLNRDGAVFNTPLQFTLNLKVGAQVMLTYNVDVIDSLTNGALGKVVGFEKSSSGLTRTVLVQFKSEKVGQNRRKSNSSYLQQKFSNIPVTPIEKIEFRFNLSKNPTSQNDFMTATQFPLKLAFACTAHKMQGATVVKPDSLVIDLLSVREAAQAYVMLSRVQSINQLFVLKEIPPKKMYPSPIAKEELNRLNSIALNNIERIARKNTLITSLNIRSLPKHHSHLIHDSKIRGQVIALQETWCSRDNENQNLELPGYQVHFVNQGRGKGVVTYFKKEFYVTGEMNTDKYQISKVSCEEFDVLNIYLSKGANKADFFRDLKKLASPQKMCIIIGDFNVDYLKIPQERLLTEITSLGFKQLVNHPTHVEGGLLDHVYIRRSNLETQVQINFPFYSDHAAIAIKKCHS